MKAFNNEQMKHARKADLYSYLISRHSSQFRREGDSLRMISNHSLSIKKGVPAYYDFSTGESGNSVDFLVKHMGYAIDEAVFSLCGDETALMYNQAAPAPSNNNVISEPLPPVFPEPLDGPYRQMFAYLKSRGIPSDTVQWLVEQKLLYQSKERNNCVFINRERDWAELRGTYTLGKGFHGVVANCRHDGFWWFRTSRDAKTAYICESAIDAISLYLLQKKAGIETPAYYISIGGVAKQPAIDRIKRQMQSVIAVDNDDAGQLCRQKNGELPYIISQGKDWNEDLQNGKSYRKQ